MAGANQIGSDVMPSSCCCSTVAIAGESSDQKLAAIMTPPVNPKAVSSNFLSVPLKKKGSNYSEGTGALRIKLNPKVNTGTDAQSGGLN